MTKRDYRSAAGFSLVEMMIVVGLAAVLTGMAVSQIGTVRPGMKGDGAMRVILGQMNQARQIAIQQRRYVRVVLTSPNLVQLMREDTTTTTSLACPSCSAFLEGGVQIVLTRVTGVGLDTPDAFPVIPFVNVTTNLKFKPDGTLVNQDGASANGTVFLAIPGVALSSRAITILGSTGRVRGYKWDGKNWNVV
jgi:prepilin-type N-terminal cleavage/methylation domain-containing protein